MKKLAKRAKGFRAWRIGYLEDVQGLGQGYSVQREIVWLFVHCDEDSHRVVENEAGVGEGEGSGGEGGLMAFKTPFLLSYAFSCPPWS